MAAIVGAYSWLEVVLIYENTEYGNSLIPYLEDAFQKVGARVPHRSVIPHHYNDREILKELNRLNSTRARIFLVHMTASLGSKLFLLASKAGMMIEGYGWIVTEGLSTLLDPVGSRTMNSMQGVVGVRPYIPMSKELEDFVLRMKIFRFRKSRITGVNLFGLWAYDTVWALAMAVEKVGIASRVDLASLGTGDKGQNLLEAILDLKFENLSGNFRLVKGQLEASTFEVFNVIGGKERIFGYWNQKKGLSRKLNRAAELDKRKTLEKPIWPRYTTDIPPKLRIGVPMEQGFNEFLKFENNHHISGFSADIFFAAVKQLPFSLSYEFSAFVGTYDDLLYQIHLQESFNYKLLSSLNILLMSKYDAVVGDTTIVANRSLYVDFMLPYTESGVSMMVLTEDSERNSLWIFLKPLSLDLWLTTGVAFIFTGFVIWLLEHRENTEFRGPPQQQLGMIFWFSFSTLVFAHSKLNMICIAFPIGSPLVSYMSRAILNMTQDKNQMDRIQLTYFDYFDNKPTCEDQSAKISSEGPSLRVSSFGGLFIIAGVASMVALLMCMYHFLCSHWPALRTISSSDSTFWEKLVEVAKHFDKKDLNSHRSV
ncbi:putative periplasmic binding protein-like I [Rosa chinensis]|uniref:Putative periplasmic binding protein-like I n=1 Tax=Rosa chinensis TaxID=74649 RepID=A0A2P6QTQ6_ROSCH|nr:putative periplasmic binding protein-like I [Rosa chinensis]